MEIARPGNPKMIQSGILGVAAVTANTEPAKNAQAISPTMIAKMVALVVFEFSNEMISFVQESNCR